MRKFVLAAALTTVSVAAPAFAGEALPAKEVEFSFQGPFGKFDRAQLQRGFQVYKEVCSACHSLKYVTYRELAEPDGPGFTVDEVKALAAETKVTDGPDTKGDMFERARRPSDGFPAPYASKEAAVAVLGAAPPDLSLITKARAGRHGTFNQLVNGMGGSEYVYSLLTGYGEPPEELKAGAPDGKHFNPYFRNGPWISMAPAIRAIMGLEGIPSVRSGMKELCAPALLALSGAATPSTAPWPKREGSSASFFSKA